MRVIDQRQPEIGVNAVAEMNVLPAPIRVQRRFYIASLAYLGKHFAKHFFALFGFRRARHIVVIQQFKAFLLLCHYIVVAGQIKLARVKLVDHCHFIFPLF